MNRPLVSIIIPIYQVEAYLCTCLDSIIEQTYENLEIICVNDGSPDGCGVILSEYARYDSRIKIIDQPNGGVAKARNAGLDAAQGTYVGFVDPDDWIEPNMYESLVDAMESSRADLVACSTIVTYQEEKYLDPNYFDLTLSGTLPMSASLMERIDVSNWNKLFRRSILEQHTIRYPENLLFEDCLFFWLYTMQCATVHCIPKKLYHYMCPPRGTMYATFRGSNPQVMDALEICCCLGRFLRKRHLLETYATPFFLLCWDHYTLTQLSSQSCIRQASQRMATVMLKEFDFLKLGADLPLSHIVIWRRMRALTKGRTAAAIQKIKDFIYLDQTKNGVRRCKLFGIRFFKKRIISAHIS